MNKYNEIHLNILTEAKKVYINQLNNNIKNTIYEFFYELNKKSSKENHRKSKEIFKRYLTEIPDYSDDKVKLISYKIYEKISENKFQNLLRANIITNTKILAAVKVNKNNITNLSVSIPENNLFIKKLLVHCAREFYKEGSLFDNNNKRTNLKECFDIILESLNNTIEEFIPIHEIIEQNLIEYKNELSDESDNSELSDESDNSEVDSEVEYENEDNTDEEYNITSEEEDEDIIDKENKNVKKLSEAENNSVKDKVISIKEDKEEDEVELNEDEVELNEDEVELNEDEVEVKKDEVELDEDENNLVSVKENNVIPQNISDTSIEKEIILNKEPKISNDNNDEKIIKLDEEELKADKNDDDSIKEVTINEGNEISVDNHFNETIKEVTINEDSLDPNLKLNEGNITKKKKKKLLKKRKKPKNFVNNYISEIENSRGTKKVVEEKIENNEVLLFSDAEDD